MYEVKFNIKHRVPRPENQSGFGWIKGGFITIQGETIEKIIDEAYQVNVPDNIDIEAISLEGNLDLGRDVSHRKTLRLDVFREL